jgi:hypothetical protein
MLGAALFGFMLSVAGCQSGDGVALGDGAEAKPAEEPVVRESELRAYCPAVTLREGTAAYTTYQRGAAPGDRSKIIYQASISDVTRSCARADGTMTISVAAAGRVVPGPVGGAGTITMPIRVVALRGSEVLYTKLHKHQVTIGTEATQFLFTDPDVVIPIPENGTVQVYAGFDSGPAAK